MKGAIIIQARRGSTRLPDKMLKPFYKNLCILEILIERLKQSSIRWPIIVATSTNTADQEIVGLCRKLSINSFCGNEENVLLRFTEAAKYFGIEQMIRVCADNPLLDVPALEKLVERAEKTEGKLDYISYTLDGETPSIMSHIGLYAEWTKIETLKSIQQTTTEKLYLEHVTNYIHQHPLEYNLELINVPYDFQNRKDIRLTVDTAEDFKMMQEIYAFLVEQGEWSSKDILNVLNQHGHFFSIMQQQIVQNSK